MARRVLVSECNPEWVVIQKFGSLAKAQAFCKKLELEFKYHPKNEDRVYLCIEEEP